MMDLHRYTVGGFELTHLMVIFILMGCALFIIYWLWVYPCSQPLEESRVTSPTSRSGRVISRPEAVSSPTGRGEIILYAMEIEPGTVVLQSPHGDMFRILREYDSVTQSGAPTSGLPPGTSYPVHYIPTYTRAHVQNMASAPPYPGVEEEEERAVRPLSSASDSWRPLCIQSGNQY